MSKIVIERLSKMNITRSEMIKNGFSSQKYDDVCRGKSSYKIDDLIKISEKFQLSLDYLIKGMNIQGNTLTDTEKNLLEVFNKLSSDDQIRISERAETLAELAAERAAEQAKKEEETAQSSADPRSAPQEPLTFPTEPEQDEEEKFYVDICSLPASAGTGVYLDDSSTEPLQIVHTDIAERANYAVRVSGDSMEPRFFDGDIVLVETCPSVEEGEIGIFIVNGEGFIKQYGDNCLISLNPKRKDIQLHEFDTVYCRGRVLGIAEVVD